MAMECPVCNQETYRPVDRETDVKGRRFVLLECEKCSRAVIVPEEEWDPTAANPEAKRTAAS